METSLKSRAVKTRDQLNKWRKDGADQFHSQRSKLRRQGEDALSSGREAWDEQRKHIEARKDELIGKGEEALDQGKGTLFGYQAAVLESARDALVKASESLGDRGAFLKRGEDALDEALIALRAGHHATLPIEGYDKLTVRKVKKQLKDLDLAALRTVHAYEAKNKNRVTLLRELDATIEELRGAEASVGARQPEIAEA